MRIDHSKSLFENFRAVAAENSDRSALTFLAADLTPTTYTYARLFERVEQIARALHAQQLSTAAPLGILLESQEAQVLHYLAALQCGLIPAILTPPNRKLDRQHYLASTRTVIEYCGFTAVVTDIEEFTDACRCLHPDQLRGNVQTGESLPRKQITQARGAAAVFIGNDRHQTGRDAKRPGRPRSTAGLFNRHWTQLPRLHC